MSTLHPYRLVPRGQPGLSCDDDGLALGGFSLVRATSSDGLRQSEVRPLEELAAVLRFAYGPQSAEVVQRCHRGLKRAAAQLQAGDLARASLEAVMIGFPELTPQAMEKLAGLANLEKGGDAWQDQPRVPAGETGGGQWTTGDGGGAPTSSSGTHIHSVPGSGSPRARTAAPAKPASPLDDIVYHPASDSPDLLWTGGADENDPRSGIGGNRSPDDYLTLQDVFPGLKEEPGLAIPLAPVDGFLGISASADEANLEGAAAEYAKLTAQIRAIDPGWRDEELQSLESMSWQERNSVLDKLQMQRAAAYFRFRGDIRPLQVETLRYLQTAVDGSYEEGVELYNKGLLAAKLSREEAIGNYIDRSVRTQLRGLFNTLRIPYGPGRDVRVNNRDPSTADQKYRVPDMSLGKVFYDWTLSPKTISTPQVRGFFRGDTEPSAVVIVRPRQLGRDSTYLIPRPAEANRTRKAAMYRNKTPYVPEGVSELYDYIGFVMLKSPTFADRTGYFPEQNLETVFYGLNEGLDRLRGKLGEPLYRELRDRSDKMRAYFAADPEDKTGQAIKGRELILEMEDLIKARGPMS